MGPPRGPLIPPLMGPPGGGGLGGGPATGRSPWSGGSAGGGGGGPPPPARPPPPPPLRYVGVPPTSRLGGLGRCAKECPEKQGAPTQPGGRSWAARFMPLRGHSHISTTGSTTLAHLGRVSIPNAVRVFTPEPRHKGVATPGAPNRPAAARPCGPLGPSGPCRLCQRRVRVCVSYFLMKNSAADSA
jgi:hypothetical protein